LFKRFVWNKDKVFLLAADEVVEKKIRQKYFCIARFFSNTEKQIITAVAFMTMSLIDELS